MNRLAACLLTVLTVLTIPCVQAATPVEDMIEAGCTGGKFGLRLPATTSGLLQLGAIVRIEDEPLDWGLSADEGSLTGRTIHFRGLTLYIIVNSLTPDGYMLDSAHIGSTRWQHLTPFQLGQSTKSLRKTLNFGPQHNLRDWWPQLGSPGSVSFGTSRGRVTSVRYACYTG